MKENKSFVSVGSIERDIFSAELKEQSPIAADYVWIS